MTRKQDLRQRRQSAASRPSGGREREAAAPPAEATVGEVIRHAREVRRESLSEIAAWLRIRENYLAAIESGQFQELPGHAYAVGFVRAYAGYLDLDAEEMVRRFKQEGAVGTSPQNLQFPAPAPERNVPASAIMATVLLIAAAGYAGWSYYDATRPDMAADVPELPGELLAMLGDGNTAAGDADVSEPAAATPAEAAVVATDSPNTALEANGTSLNGIAEDDENGLAHDNGSATAASGTAETGVAEPTAEAGDVATVPAAADADGAAVSSGDVAAPVGVPAQRPRSAPAVADGDTGGAADSAPAVAEATTAGDNGATGDGAAQAGVADDGAAQAETAAGQGAPDNGVAALPSAIADPDGVVLGAARGDARIVLHARSDSWIQVRESNGEVRFTRVLRTGDVYRVPRADSLRLITGNAGGLAVYVDGERAPNLGAVGEVRRNIALAPEALAGGET